MMKTKIVSVDELNIDEAKLKEAGDIINKGGLVAFPTETVYGIGANALVESSIMKIYEAKGRPSDNPLIMHISDKEQVAKYVQNVSHTAKKLMDAFWPGPLTLIFTKNDMVPKAITGGLNTVAIRMPSHPIASGIIRYAGVPVAAPSANLSGKPSPTRGRHVIEDLNGRVDMIIDGGKATLGLESTVLDVSGTKPCILRPGSITKSMLEDIVGDVDYDAHLSDISEVPKAPGMKYKHYAPSGNLTIVSSDDELKVIEYINSQVIKQHKANKKVGIITPKHAQESFDSDLVLCIGNIDDANEIASNLFNILRKMDEHHIDEIYSFEYPGEEVSVAIMNRLMKAAGYSIINV